MDGAPSRTDPKNPFRKAIAVLRHTQTLARGYAAYSRTGHTPVEAYNSMRQLYCLTDGYFNDAVSLALGALRKPYPLGSTLGILGDMQGEALAQTVRTLDERGYVVSDHVLPAELCDELVAFAHQTPCGAGRSVIFDGTQTSAPRHDFEPADILKCPAVVGLLADHSLLAIAQAYLRSRAVFDLIAMWWSTASPSKALSEAAQLYHFDMDRIKFLKVFFYLTDVDTDTGPHCYVPASHRRKPVELLRDGRFSDDEIAQHYGTTPVEITGPRGTILLADTRGFHKGKPLVRGSRLLLQFEYAPSLFGYDYPPFPLPAERTLQLAPMLEKYPFTFSHFRPV